jgi:hypothetical protein
MQAEGVIHRRALRAGNAAPSNMILQRKKDGHVARPLIKVKEPRSLTGEASLLARVICIASASVVGVVRPLALDLPF